MQHMTCCANRPARHARDTRRGAVKLAACNLGGLSAWLPDPAGAATATEAAAHATELGPWLFAAVALVLVAALAWWLGRATGRLAGGGAPVSTETATAAQVDRALAAGSTQPAAAGTRAPPTQDSRLATARAAATQDDAAAFSYALSHDLRAPLRVVEGFARILKEDYGRQLDRIGNDHLDRMLGASARMNAMIDAMLALAQLSNQPLASVPVDLSQLAQQVVDELRRTQPERRVDVHIAPGLHTRGDPVLLRQMLDNLIGNAWKYSARAEPARISLTERPGAAAPGLRAFELADNGAGFDMRAADRLFGLFQRLHAQSEFPGTGLGLASVLRIVRRHGGEIHAEGEPGRGARFFFTLPG